MNESAAKTSPQVIVWVPADAADRERAGLPSFRSSRETALTPVKVDAEKIAKSLNELVDALSFIVSKPASKPGFSVDELELNLTISATGEVGFIASVSAGVEASITVRMKRS